MPVAGLRRRARDSHSRPLVLLSVKNPDIVEIASLELGSLPKIGSLLQILIKGEASLDDHVGPHLDGRVALPRGGNRPFAFGLRPGHHLQVQHVQVVEVFLPVCTPEDEDFCLVHQHCRVPVPR